jgi:adenylate cyclase
VTVSSAKIRLTVDSKHKVSTTSHRAGKTLLRHLLEERNQYPERAEEIDARIREAFERHVAILVLDMSGFSRLTVEFGIIHYLAMIAQMDTSSRPAVTGNNGTVIKQEADNLFAIFPTPADAVEGALDIFRAFEAVNAVVPVDRDLFGSIGIGYGDTLLVGDDDMFGSEMNLASKLGEDLAERHEILLTASAHAALPPDHYVCEQRTYEISGMRLECYVLEDVVRPSESPAPQPPSAST